MKRWDVALGMCVGIGLTVTAATADLWEDTWTREDPDIDAVQCVRSPECGEYTPQSCRPFTAKYRTNTLKQSPCSIPGKCIVTSLEPRKMYFFGQNRPGIGGEGFHMLTREQFNRHTYLSAEVKVRAMCGPNTIDGCFFGLTIYNGESNYREIAYSSPGGYDAMQVWRFAGGACEVTPLTPILPQGDLHTLRLDYYGHEGGTWVYIVDNIVRHIEHADAPNPLGRMMHENPSVGFFFSGYTDGGWIAGDAGPLRVWSDGVKDQEQASIAGMVKVLPWKWIAQEIILGEGVQNIARIRLFLQAQESYQFALRLSEDNKPGRLINAVAYTALHTGWQDVPVILPRRLANRVWIAVSGVTEGATLATSFPGKDAYPGRFLVSHDVGISWSVREKDLSFITYERK